MVRLLPRVASIAFAASVCWSCGSDSSSTSPDAGNDSGTTGGPSLDAGAETGPAENDAGGGIDASDGAVADAPAEVDAASTTFTLTSSAFPNMGDLDASFVCGSDVSPPLAWTPGPAGTQSYGVVMTDAKGVYYWLLWDIPAATASLPQGVDHSAVPATPAGSEQMAAGLDMSTSPGYVGPCPSLPETPYTFVVYALSVVTLPGVTMSSTASDVIAAIQANALANAKLIGLATHFHS